MPPVKWARMSRSRALRSKDSRLGMYRFWPPHSSVSRVNASRPMASAMSRYRMADYAYEVIMDRIKEFEDELDDEHEIALKLASFGQSITLAVTDIGYSNPTTLVFYGYVGTQKATLVQNLNQLNFLLLAVKKADPEKPPRRIGFSQPTED